MLWRAVERHRVDQMTIVGDAFARPMLEALREGRYDVSSVRVIGSTAAVFSASIKRELAALLPEGVMFIESVGATEAGLQAMSWDAAAGPSGQSVYQLRDNSVVLSDDRRRSLAPGTDEVGWLATKGHLPLGYLRDPERTRETFPVIDGVRYCLDGDRARFADDGRLVFLGRESMCINTGGEKVFPEEVQSSGERLSGGDAILQVDTYPLTIYSAAAIQELNQKLQRKEKEINELKRSLEEQGPGVRGQGSGTT